MRKEQIATAATIDEAKNLALQLLNAPVDADVKIEVLDMPKNKILGLFGGKEAKVMASYEIPDPPKPAPKKEVKPAPKKEEKPAPKKEESTAAKQEPKQQKPKAEKPKSEKPAKSAKPQPKKEEKPAEKQAPVEVKPVPEEADNAIKGYLSAIISGMGVGEFTIDSRLEGDEAIFDVQTEDGFGQLIGKHGDTLDAIQYLVRLFANKKCPEYKRISINVGDYRERRSDHLKALARKNANNVLKYGRPAKLEPMNPYERRIVHTTVQTIDGVTSHSVGFDANRRVIITLEEGVQPQKQDRRRSGGKGGYDNRDRGRGGRGGRGGYGGKSRAPQTPPADRAPKNDAAGVRYGKIEVAPKPAEAPAEAQPVETAPEA